MKAIYFIALFAVSTNLFAFNSSRCHQFNNDGYPPRVISSLTSFTTSTGPCRAIGMREEREELLTASMEIIVAESAHGEGEFVDALAELSGCGNSQKRMFGAAVQAHFDQIYFDKADLATPEKIGSRIDRMISDDPGLKKFCQTLFNS